MVNLLRKYAAWGSGILLLAAVLFPAGDIDNIESIDSAKFNPENPYISIYFSISDSKGEFIRTLSKEDIQLKVNDVKRTDYTLKRDYATGQWLQVMAVVDTSGSMKGKPLQDEKNALNTFARNLGDFDKIALVTFDKTPVLRVPFTREKAEFSAKVNAITTGGSTALYDAVALALQQAGSTPAPRKAIVVTSDGINNAGKIKYEELLNKIKQAAIPVYTIALGQKNEKVLKGISDASGGLYFFSPSSDDLLDIYFKIGENLKNIYVIEGLRLYDMETTPVYKIEITHRETGKTMIYRYTPPIISTGNPGVKVNPVPYNTGDKFKLPGFKEAITGKNIYITAGLAFFILILILLTWIFFRGSSIVIKSIMTIVFLLLYVVLQYIFFIIV